MPLTAHNGSEAACGRVQSKPTDSLALAKERDFERIALESNRMPAGLAVMEKGSANPGIVMSNLLDLTHSTHCSSMVHSKSNCGGLTTDNQSSCLNHSVTLPMISKLQDNDMKM